MSIIHFSSVISAAQADSENLAFIPALLSAEFQTESIAATVFIQFIFRTDGTYDIQTSNGSGETSGTWRTTGGTDTTTYEYRITHAENGSNQGTVAGALGGIIDGTWTTLASDDGIIVSVPDPGAGLINRQESDVTFEIREILVPANTTGESSTKYTAENDRS